MSRESLSPCKRIVPPPHLYYEYYERYPANSNHVMAGAPQNSIGGNRPFNNPPIC
jgi:hypothetical protein